MAAISTVGQKTVGTSAVQLTATAGQSIRRGVRLSVSTSGKCYYGFSSGVTTSTGFYIPTSTEIHAADADFLSDIYLISDTAAQQISYSIVGQTATIS
jgi:hypothetical protein